MDSTQVRSTRSGRRTPGVRLHHRLSIAMEAAGLTIPELARYLRVSDGTVRNYLRKRTSPNHSAIVLWAERCDVDPGWLEYGFGVSPSNPDDEDTASEVPNIGSGWTARVTPLRAYARAS